MSDTESNDAASAAVLDVLGPPPEEFDESAAPSGVLETILLRFLARVIHADGNVDPLELTTLVEIACNLELDGTEARRILDDELQKQSDVKELASQLPEEQMRKEAFAMGCMMCCADGSVADAERKVLFDFAEGAGIGKEQGEQILAKLTAAMQKAKADAQA